MLIIFILQNLYDCADMKVMNKIIDSRAFIVLCAINSLEKVPGDDTIGRFRNILEEHNLQEKIFGAVLDKIPKCGLILRKWTIVYFTFRNHQKNNRRKSSMSYVADLHPFSSCSKAVSAQQKKRT